MVPKHLSTPALGWNATYTVPQDLLLRAKTKKTKSIASLMSIQVTPQVLCKAQEMRRSERLNSSQNIELRWELRSYSGMRNSL